MIELLSSVRKKYAEPRYQTSHRLTHAEGSRALDQEAIHTYQIPGLILMENAGRGTVELLMQHYHLTMLQGVQIFCGRGNNGGDGFVIARHLHNQGYPVQLWLVCDSERIQGDARINFDIARTMGLPIHEIRSEETWHQARAKALWQGLAVDALLGTGLSNPVDGLLGLVINDINRSGLPIAAVDIPSGLDATTGKAHGATIRADLTATYGLIKLGQVQDPALEWVGELHLVDISLPREQRSRAAAVGVLEGLQDLRDILPHRPAAANKGTFGHVMLVAGSLEKSGAAVLAAHAAARSGAGLVTLAIPQSAVSTLRGLRPEIMLFPLPDEGLGYLTSASLEPLYTACQGKQALAVGPGLGTDLKTEQFLAGLLSQVSLPLVLDADGLNLLRGRPEQLRAYRAGLVLTPHPGEAGRLLGLSAGQIQQDRPSAAMALARATEGIAVLKGARTLTASLDHGLSVNPTGCHGMASGGSGDVLTGLIAGLLAQGLSPWNASRLGVFLHGLAGELAAERGTARSLLAGDLTDTLWEAFQVLEGKGAA